MSLFKCKMCGGELEIGENQTIATCEYCGTQQTLPRICDDKKANLYDRANHFRRNNEFDKAMGIYEQILNEDNTDAESYWSLVLCRYGIEYVEDPATHRRVPTVNRAQFTSVFDDDNYKSAIKYADIYQKAIYEKEATEINEIQKGILTISQNEEPFDVFICYKETDKSGARTRDSALANELYHQLTQDGFKVFFSRITLEDKLGTAYEPYIFAALNSAKVMVVIGTKPEYFNAVWVRNEWSRYLALVKESQGKKMLIPAYKDMDPYDLPEEFSHLQAQDMSKLGFMQDLTRGIKKILSVEKPKTVVKETVVVNSANADIAPLLKRVFMFLEDREWNKADEFCEQVLNKDPENAQAYLGKLMAELGVRKKEDLKNCNAPFNNSINYQKIMRFGDDTLKNELQECVKYIEERNENARLTALYNDAVDAMQSATTEPKFLEAKTKFEAIKGFKDADVLAEKCGEEAIKARKRAIVAFAVCATIAVMIAFVFVWVNAIQPMLDYNNAVALMEQGEYGEAISAFKALNDYKDSGDKIAECNYNIAVELMEQGEYGEAISVFEELNEYKDSKEKIEECNAEIKYNNAIILMEKEEYREAIAIFDSIDGHKKDEVVAKSAEIRKILAPKETASAGSHHTVGLKSDGTVVAVRDNEKGQCDVSKWKDIIAVSAGDDHTVGLKQDGTVVAVGNNGSGQCDVSNWKEIIAVSAEYYHTVGLKQDGTVVAVGRNKYGLSSWEDIIAVSAGDDHTVGLKSDGTVVAVGRNKYGQCDVSKWKDIIAVSAGWGHTVGLKSDGTVVAVGADGYGQCDVWNWKDIIAVSAGDDHTIGLKSDGTVVAVGDNEGGQCDVSSWKDIIAVSAGNCHTVGLKSDGTVVAVGDNFYGQCNVSSWENIATTTK